MAQGETKERARKRKQSGDVVPLSMGLFKHQNSNITMIDIDDDEEVK